MRAIGIGILVYILLSLAMAYYLGKLSMEYRVNFPKNLIRDVSMVVLASSVAIVLIIWGWV